MRGNEFTRRRFLRDGAAASAGVWAAPSVLSAATGTPDAGYLEVGPTKIGAPDTGSVRRPGRAGAQHRHDAVHGVAEWHRCASAHQDPQVPSDCAPSPTDGPWRGRDLYGEASRGRGHVRARPRSDPPDDLQRIGSEDSPRHALEDMVPRVHPGGRHGGQRQGSRRGSRRGRRRRRRDRGRRPGRPPDRRAVRRTGRHPGAARRSGCPTCGCGACSATMAAHSTSPASRLDGRRRSSAWRLPPRRSRGCANPA